MADRPTTILYTAAPSPTIAASVLQDLARTTFANRYMDLNDVGSDQVALYLSSSQGTDQIV